MFERRSSVSAQDDSRQEGSLLPASWRKVGQIGVLMTAGIGAFVAGTEANADDTKADRPALKQDSDLPSLDNVIMSNPGRAQLQDPAEEKTVSGSLDGASINPGTGAVVTLGLVSLAALCAAGYVVRRIDRTKRNARKTRNPKWARGIKELGSLGLILDSAAFGIQEVRDYLAQPASGDSRRRYGNWLPIVLTAAQGEIAYFTRGMSEELRTRKPVAYEIPSCGSKESAELYYRTELKSIFDALEEQAANGSNSLAVIRLGSSHPQQLLDRGESSSVSVWRSEGNAFWKAWNSLVNDYGTEKDWIRLRGGTRAVVIQAPEPQLDAIGLEVTLAPLATIGERIDFISQAQSAIRDSRKPLAQSRLAQAECTRLARSLWGATRSALLETLASVKNTTTHTRIERAVTAFLTAEGEKDRTVKGALEAATIVLNESQSRPQREFWVSAATLFAAAMGQTPALSESHLASPRHLDFSARGSDGLQETERQALALRAAFLASEIHFQEKQSGHHIPGLIESRAVETAARHIVAEVLAQEEVAKTTELLQSEYIAHRTRLENQVSQLLGEFDDQLRDLIEAGRIPDSTLSKFASSLDRLLEQAGENLVTGERIEFTATTLFERDDEATESGTNHLSWTELEEFLAMHQQRITQALLAA